MNDSDISDTAFWHSDKDDSTANDTAVAMPSDSEQDMPELENNGLSAIDDLDELGAALVEAVNSESRATESKTAPPSSGDQVLRRSQRATQPAAKTLENIVNSTEGGTALAAVSRSKRKSRTPPAPVRKKHQEKEPSPTEVADAVWGDKTEAQQKALKALVVAKISKLEDSRSSDADAARTPETRAEMLRGNDSERYITAERKHLKEKIFGLGVMSVVKLDALPPGAKPIATRWVYASKIREHSNGEVEHSARVVAKGFAEVQQNNYLRYDCPTMQLPAYLMNEARAARDASIVREGWDVSGAYYRSDPRKIFYVYAPPGYDRSKESGDIASCGG